MICALGLAVEQMWHLVLRAELLAVHPTHCQGSPIAALLLLPHMEHAVIVCVLRNVHSPQCHGVMSPPPAVAAAAAAPAPASAPLAPPPPPPPAAVAGGGSADAGNTGAVDHDDDDDDDGGGLLSVTTRRLVLQMEQDLEPPEFSNVQASQDQVEDDVDMRRRLCVCVCVCVGLRDVKTAFLAVCPGEFKLGELKHIFTIFELT